MNIQCIEFDAFLTIDDAPDIKMRKKDLNILFSSGTRGWFLMTCDREEQRCRFLINIIPQLRIPTKTFVDDFQSWFDRLTSQFESKLCEL